MCPVMAVVVLYLRQARHAVSRCNDPIRVDFPSYYRHSQRDILVGIGNHAYTTLASSPNLLLILVSKKNRSLVLLDKDLAGPPG